MKRFAALSLALIMVFLSAVAEPITASAQTAVERKISAEGSDNTISESLNLANSSDVVLPSEQIFNFNIYGEDHFDYANEVLTKLNALRRSLGLNELEMDQELLTAAMQRAAEISIYYSHTRPNGQSCSTAFSRPYGWGENIAWGQRDPTSVMTSWTNSSGHYQNMTTAYYASVGIGCFRASDGSLCWVQLFSNYSANPVYKSGITNTLHYISAKGSVLDFDMVSNTGVHSVSVGQNFKMDIVNNNKELYNYGGCQQKIDSGFFTFGSSNSNVAVPTNNGYFTVKGSGKVSVTASFNQYSSLFLTNSYDIGHKYTNYSSSPASAYSNGYSCKTCSICGKEYNKIIYYSLGTVALSKTEFTYTGKKITPKIIVKDYKGNVISSSNYKVTYTGDGIKTGVHWVNLEFIGNYFGHKYLQFVIRPASANRCTAKLSTNSYTYNGKRRSPKVITKNAAGKTLKLGTDYTVTYSYGGIYVGTYYAYITYKGNYTGRKTLKFSIKPPKTTVTSVIKGSKRFTVKWKKKNAQVSGYQIQYSTKANFKSSKKITVYNPFVTTRTVKKLKGAKKYYVRIRTYYDSYGTRTYSAWSAAKTVTTKK